MVLAELRRLSEGFESVRDDIAKLVNSQNLDRQSVETVRRDLDRELQGIHNVAGELSRSLDKYKKSNDTRVDKLEQNDIVATAFTKGKVWVVSLAFIIATAIVLPTVALLWKG
jgi:hypothetical protein